jgi:hypothetical protein
MTNKQNELIYDWYDAKEAAEAAKSTIELEQNLRKKVVEELFKNAPEGTQKLELGNGYTLKASIKLDRKLDEAALSAVSEELRKTGFNPEMLIEYKPSLKTKIYRELSVEQTKIFDKALIVKPASPTLELVLPK